MPNLPLQHNLLTVPCDIRMGTAYGIRNTCTVDYLSLSSTLLHGIIQYKLQTDQTTLAYRMIKYLTSAVSE